MDPSVRAQALASRLLQQSLYATEGLVGEGAFGVVLKARRTASGSSARGRAEEGAGADREEKQKEAAASSAAVAGASSAATPASAAAAASSASASAAPAQYVAIKKMLNSREGQGIPQDAYREIKMLRELRHPNLVPLLDVFTRWEAREVDLVYEYAPHDLAEIVRETRLKAVQTKEMQRAAREAAQAQASGVVKGTPPRSIQSSYGLSSSSNTPVYTEARLVKSILHQLLQGLAYMHSSWVMHRDLKPANILLSEKGRVLIADFGLARIFAQPSRRLYEDGEVVTVWYRAPELLMGCKHYTRAIDCFALGAIFYELITCLPLFPGAEVKQGDEAAAVAAAAAASAASNAASSSASAPAKLAVPGAAAAAPAAAAVPSSSRPFQVHQLKRVFEVLGKPTLERWPGLADCPHYPLIKGWSGDNYPGTLASLLASPQAAGGSAAARDLLRRLLEYDPSRRISAEDALQHAYFRESPLPSACVFLDSQEKRVHFKARETKPFTAAKRGREAAAAAAAAAGGQQQQQTAAVVVSAAAAHAHAQSEAQALSLLDAVPAPSHDFFVSRPAAHAGAQQQQQQQQQQAPPQQSRRLSALPPSGVEQGARRAAQGGAMPPPEKKQRR